jgi:hypothetical protein
MYLGIFESIVQTIGEWSSKIGLDWIVVAGLALVMLTIIISFIATEFSIEVKTAKAINSINKYLELNPFINEENLVEFNKLMKSIPAPLRVQWQQYMVNRDKKPSEFFTEHNCIDKPFKASGYMSQIVAVRAFTICIAVLSSVFSLAYFANVYATDFSYAYILTSLLFAGVDVMIGEIYLLFLKSRRNSNISDVYFTFNNMQKYLDRAVTTLPEYVDYEILFTRKEITAGIPVLQEYLQQRATFEQEQIKKAKESQVEHQQYDFSALGINGSLVMEKAMRECEYFLGNKKRILSEIAELKSSEDMLDKNYDEKNKNSERKLRDIKESLDRLKEKLDSTTNLIVGNDLRKQRENEIQKQRQLEKEAEDDNRKYEADKKQLNDQIEAKKAEIEEFRKGAETSLNNEFKTYADKIYGELKTVADGQVKDQLDTLSADNIKLQQELENKDRIIVEKNTVYSENKDLLDEYSNKIATRDKIIADNGLAVPDGDVVEENKELFEAKKEVESRNLEIHKKDEQIENQKSYINQLKSKKHLDGDEIFADNDGKLFYFDDKGHKNYLSRRPVTVDELNKVLDGQDIPDAEPEAQETNKSPVEAPVEATADLGFTDADILPVEDTQAQAKDDEPEKPVEIVEDKKTEDNLQDSKEKPQKVDDVENQQNKNGEEKQSVEDAEITKLDQEIARQNQELEKQAKDLSKQLEETQKVIDAQTDDVANKQSLEQSQQQKDEPEVKQDETVEQKETEPKAEAKQEKLEAEPKTETVEEKPQQAEEAKEEQQKPAEQNADAEQKEEKPEDDKKSTKTTAKKSTKRPAEKKTTAKKADSKPKETAKPKTAADKKKSAAQRAAEKRLASKRAGAGNANGAGSMDFSAFNKALADLINKKKK